MERLFVEVERGVLVNVFEIKKLELETILSPKTGRPVEWYWEIRTKEGEQFFSPKFNSREEAYMWLSFVFGDLVFFDQNIA